MKLSAYCKDIFDVILKFIEDLNFDIKSEELINACYEHNSEICADKLELVLLSNDFDRYETIFLFLMIDNLKQM